MSVSIYHFWSPTCGPCQVIKPAIGELRKEFADATWVSVNTREDPNGFSGKFGVSVVPTIVVVSVDPQGKARIEKHSGTQMMGYYRIIRNAMRVISPQ